MSKTIIFLDFDGVLCDSVKEAYILARYAYSKIDVHKPIESDKYDFFMRYRYLISNSWQYYYLMRIIEENLFSAPLDVEERFEMFIQNGKDENSDIFNKDFLVKRKELMENEFKFWNELETPTLFLERLKKILNNTNNCTFAILSTKNKEAIIKKFKAWNIEFDSNFIFEKKDLENLTKGEFIDAFMDSHSEFSNSILIDDNEENIYSCANIEKVQAYLTSWGYIKNSQNTKNEDEILKIIKEEL